MKMKRVTWTVFIIALVLAVLFNALEQYYIAIALVIGLLILRHREIWSLLRRRKLPPTDERVREISGKAIRNGFVYMAAATAFMMLPFGEILTDDFDLRQVLAVLFLTTGAVYMFSSIYYDRVEPKMSEKRQRLMKGFLLTSGMAVAVFIISVILHNGLSALFGIEEPVFFIIAVIGSPVAFVAGVIGSLVLLFTGLAKKAS